jgi:hypothetical protein
MKGDGALGTLGGPPKAAAAALSRKRRRDTPDRQYSNARHDSAVIAQFPGDHFAGRIVQQHYVRSCGLLSLKSSILLSVPAIERAAPDTLAAEKCILDKPDDRRLIGHR